jgi:hypothetical protein
MELCRGGMSDVCSDIQGGCPNHSSCVDSGPAEGGNRPLVVGTTSARPFSPTRSRTAFFFCSAASRSFGGGADPDFRSLAPDRRMLCL